LADITFADVGRAAVVSLSAHACAGLILLLGGGVDAKHIGKLENLHAANRQHCIVWPSVGLRWFQQLSAAFSSFQALCICQFEVTLLWLFWRY
jgi:hypothetical protein